MNLGIIGLSEGNGHPYSWAAIFNGFDHAAMESCPFPVIPAYLAKQQFPQDFLTAHRVTHIWTQDISVAKDVAAASLIDNIVNRPEDMVGQIDALLLARDDAESHYELALPFLKAGLPVYIDKPLGRTVAEVKRILDAQKYDWQIYSCSALRYAPELVPSQLELETIGELRLIEAITPKYWDTYAVHVLESLVAFRGKIKPKNVQNWKGSYLNNLRFTDQYGVDFQISAVNNAAAPLQIRFIGSLDSWTSSQPDSFRCFRTALNTFVEGVVSKTLSIPREETINIVSLIEMGR